MLDELVKVIQTNILTKQITNFAADLNLQTLVKCRPIMILNAASSNVNLKREKFKESICLKTN